MIVTRSWLEEFIDLSDVSNKKLYQTFNAIGLEVDTIEHIKIPNGVVVGKVLSCEKHPDADKLSVCQIDIGEDTKQIVCGAKNISNGQFVAVATIGSILSKDFHIKPTELRGVASDGMVCSSTELGLPKINSGIMILDESIGALEIGKNINQYSKIADTVIELELTANRGDCLSIHGVARDLSASLNKDIKTFNFESNNKSKVAIARKFSITNHSDTPLSLQYKLSQNKQIRNSNLLINIRLGFVGLELADSISNIVRYSTHATGVILRAYDSEKLQNGDQSTVLTLTEEGNKLVTIKKESSLLSTIGVNQAQEYLPDDKSKAILFEASYIEPEILIEGLASSKIESDMLYYKTSRGSEPDLIFGMRYLEWGCSIFFDFHFANSSLVVESEKDERIIAVNFQELNDIIGQKTGKSEVSNILTRLGFKIHRNKGSESFGILAPPHRHDILHIQDVAEEILRIVGINNIDAKPLELTEKVRLTNSTTLYRAKRDLRVRATGRGFFEAVTYAFCDQSKLEKYGFDTLDESLKLLNPIAEEFNTMRSTLLINLLDSVKRNINYGIKRIPLFEIGTVFDKQRNESEHIAFVWSGHIDSESIDNQGKAETISFPFFVKELTAIIGEVELVTCKSKNGLMHPYQSAHIIKKEQIIGFVSKLHPLASDTYAIPDTFVAEMSFAALMPEHISVSTISNYQGVYKDLSIVIDKDMPYSKISQTIGEIENSILKRFYPIDVYKDQSLAERKSVTIRFFIQSTEGTMSDNMIDDLMQDILQKLETDLGAKIR
ncbi:MAG: phenylalanine--tRNA ligase subunit beta [Sulfurovum sp.]|nr:phenylalanine--tRNA ligase subunit beta [Sulfurovum sp.]